MIISKLRPKHDTWLRYYDDFGTITQRVHPTRNDMGGGDTANRVGLYGIHLALGGSNVFEPARPGGQTFYRMVSALEVEPGVYRRHPDKTRVTGDPRTFTRDQHDALMIACGLHGFKKRARRAVVKILKRGFRYQNVYPNHWPCWPKADCVEKKFPDIAGPIQWGVWIRALEYKALWPLLWMTDTVLFFNSIHKAFFYARELNHAGLPVSDDVNHIVRLVQSAASGMDTWLAKAARWVYKRFRPAWRLELEVDKDLDMYYTEVKERVREPGHGPQFALDFYFKYEDLDAPFNELYRTIIKEYL